FEQTHFSRKNPPLVIECSPKNVDPGLINQAHRFRPDFVRSLRQLLRIAFRRESDNFHPLRNIARHFERTLADGSCRAQDNDALTSLGIFHSHSDSNDGWTQMHKDTAARDALYVPLNKSDDSPVSCSLC